jgi:hypothetical protein
MQPSNLARFSARINEQVVGFHTFILIRHLSIRPEIEAG